MVKILGVVLIVVLLFLFFIYSMLSQNNSKEMQKKYSGFKKQYREGCIVGFGMNQNNVFSTSYQLMIAIEEESHIVLDAILYEGNTFEITCKEATEFIGINADKYLHEKQVAFDGNYYNLEKRKLSGKEKAFVNAINFAFGPKKVTH